MFIRKLILSNAPVVRYTENEQFINDKNTTSAKLWYSSSVRTHSKPFQIQYFEATTSKCHRFIITTILFLSLSFCLSLVQF